MKTKILIFLLMTAVCIGAYAQSLSGRYVADDEDSLFQVFEFTRSTVRITSVEIMGYTNKISATYTIEDGIVIISLSGAIMELEIIDSNTLVGVGFGIEDVIFRKKR